MCNIHFVKDLLDFYVFHNRTYLLVACVNVKCLSKCLPKWHRQWGGVHRAKRARAESPHCAKKCQNTWSSSSKQELTADFLSCLQKAFKWGRNSLCTQSRKEKKTLSLNLVSLTLSDWQQRPKIGTKVFIFFIAFLFIHFSIFCFQYLGSKQQQKRIRKTRKMDPDFLGGDGSSVFWGIIHIFSKKLENDSKIEDVPQWLFSVQMKVTFLKMDKYVLKMELRSSAEMR